MNRVIILLLLALAFAACTRSEKIGMMDFDYIIDTINDLSVSAKNDINVTAAENSYNEREEHEETTISLTAKVGNAYTNAALALKAVADAAQAEKDAARALEAIKELWNDGKATSDAVYQAEANLLMESANLLQATINAATAAAQAAASGAAAGTGMYVNGGVSLESTTDFFEIDNKTYTSSELASGGNSIFNAGRNMNQIGSSASSIGDVTYNIKGNLRLKAVKETSTTESGETSANISFSAGTNGVSMISGGKSSSSDKSGDSWYVNSSTNADGKINYNVDVIWLAWAITQSVQI